MKGPTSGPSGETNGGPIEFKIKDTREGELWACAYAIAWAFEKYKHDDLDSIVLQCDNVEALGILNTTPLVNARAVKASHGTHPISNRVFNISKSEGHAIALINQTAKGKMIWLKHVKGHQNGVHARSAVNEAVDKIAKEYMREQREGIIQKLKASP